MPSDHAADRSVPCVEIADELAAAEDGLLDARARTHVAECLRCQAELANYRRLRRTMRRLGTHAVPVDPTLEHDILLALDREDDRLLRRVPARAAATIGGLAAAAGVIVIATRQRRATRLAG